MFKSQNDQPKGKRRFVSTPTTTCVKRTDFQIYVLPKPTLVTPKGTEDLEFAHAGLGKRLLSLPDNLKHHEIVSLLEDEFPKLKNLEGGWMFYKSTGGGGQRKLSVIPTDTEGYSTRLLKSASNGGKNVLFVVPLQEEMSTDPLPYDSVEFSKMPQANCMKCGKKIPLQLLPLHVEDCGETYTETETDVTIIEEEVCAEIDQPIEQSRGSEDESQICPICQISFPSDILPYHASMCGEKEATFDDIFTREEQPGPSRTQSVTAPKMGWENEIDPQKACNIFREELLNAHSEQPSLTLILNQFDDVDEQDGTLVSFYKMNNVSWAAPLKCRLRGDAAVGTGVNRHVLSMVMQKLKTGFMLNLGSSAATLFDGEKDHRVPSASAVLRDSNLFQMAGRMIGHSFLHGGPSLTGLSVPVVILLTGGTIDSAASSLTLQDCPDMDHRETISLLNKAELDEAERTRLNDLCLFWDLPVPSPTNREWLFQQLLTHAVLGRVKKQIKDLRKGLKETGIWPLLSNRQDVYGILFPRESTLVIDSQTVLQKITWPKLTEDDDDDDDISVEKLTVISGYMRTFIEEASPAVLSDLTRFWVGWEIPEENLVLEVVTAEYPVAHTCFNTLSLPCHYQNYTTFKKDMLMCLNSLNSGFGLV